MSVLRSILILIGTMFFALSHQTQATEPRPHTLQEFVKLPATRDVRISPDGVHFSVVIRQNGEDKLAILETATKKPISVFRVKGKRRSVGDVHWVSNERILYSVNESYYSDKALRDTGELIGTNIDGSRHKMIFGHSTGEKQVGGKIKKKKADYGHHKIIDLLENDEKHVLIIFYPWKLRGSHWIVNHQLSPSVYKLNIFSGKRKFVSMLNVPGAYAITDAYSKVRFSVGVDDENNSVVSYRKKEEDEWREFSLNGFSGTDVRPLSFTESNESVYLTAAVDGGTRGLFKFDLKDESFVTEFHDPKVDISLHIKDYSNRRVVIIGTDLDLPNYQYLKPKDKKAKLHKMLRASFPRHDIQITSSTKDGNRSVVFVYSDKNSGDYYLFDTVKKAADHLFSKSQWLDPELMSETNPISINTRDNVQLQGYLTLPKKKSKGVPMVVMPHGGPHGVRDYWGYDWEVQLLASAGYGVLQINYRGSGGFGKKFQSDGYGKWGTLMQDDITDSTNAMIEQGIAVKDRICIYGASYGGYAALMGVSREPELYQCAIGSMGVYDLPMLFESGDVSERKSGLAYLKEVIGNDIEDQKKRSPVYNIGKIKANVFLIHGEKDRRAPIEQAEALKEAFDKAGKKYAWLRLGNEGHGYYDEKNRLEVYTKILEFLNENIGD